MDISERPMKVGRVHRARTLLSEEEVHQRSPEQRLCLALIEDAIKVAFGPAAQNQTAQADAYAWLRGVEYPGRMTFAFCCDHLGLNPDYIRRGLGLRTTPIRLIPRCNGTTAMEMGRRV